VQEVLRKLENKNKKTIEAKLKQSEELKARQNEQKKKWDGKRLDIQNKEYVINPETVHVNFASLKKFGKSSPSKSPRAGDNEGSASGLLIFEKPVEYLANFTLDRDKINFFEKA